MKRNYGIDLLRIAAMCMVVILHIVGFGGVLTNAKTLSANYEAALFLQIATYCAVNCYALISGYVGLNSKFHYTNIVILWLRVVFYTLLTLQVSSFFGFQHLLVLQLLVVFEYFQG